MEQTIRKEQDEKVGVLRCPFNDMSHYQRALLADLTAMRELCVQLDKAKDAHSRQVVTVSAELEQVLMLYSREILNCIHLLQLQERLVVLQGEKDALETQLSVEKAGNRGLETLLASERKKVCTW